MLFGCRLFIHDMFGCEIIICFDKPSSSFSRHGNLSTIHGCGQADSKYLGTKHVLIFVYDSML